MTLQPPTDPLPNAPRAAFARSLRGQGEPSEWTAAMLVRVVLQTADPAAQGRRAAEGAIDALVDGLLERLCTMSFRGEVVLGSECAPSHSIVDGTSAPLKIKILYKSKDHPDRKIAESLLIRKNRPELNSNVSSWPIL